MNGRSLNPGNSNSETNLMYNNIQYNKPVHFINQQNANSKHTYYDNNPYFLNNNYTHRVKGIYTTSRHQNNSKDYSDASSQRSGKVVRANGLRVAEKPKFIKEKTPEQRQTSYSQSRNIQQGRKVLERNIHLEEQNRNLLQENRILKQTIKNNEDKHKKELYSLNAKFQMLMKRTEQLQNIFAEQNREFNQKIQQYSSIKSTNESQANHSVHQHIQIINKDDVRSNSSAQNSLFSTFNSKVENVNLKK